MASGTISIPLRAVDADYTTNTEGKVATLYNKSMGYIISAYATLCHINIYINASGYYGFEILNASDGSPKGNETVTVTSIIFDK